MNEEKLKLLIIGAIVGLVVRYIAMRLIKPDSIKVDLGFPSGAFERGPQMDIQNFSDHKIKLRDFGFIKLDGSRFSLPEEYAASGFIDERINYDKTVLEARENLAASLNVDLETIGAFAYSTAQHFPRITFNRKISIFMQIWVRIYVYWRFLRGYAYWDCCLPCCKNKESDLL
jgi:hypothetical protein